MIHVLCSVTEVFGLHCHCRATVMTLVGHPWIRAQGLFPVQCRAAVVCCNMWSPLSWKPLQVMQNCIYMLLGAGFTAPSLPSASMLLFTKAYSDKSTSWCVVSYPQPPRRALWSSECWDCCRNHLIQAGRHGLHHLDLLLQTADDESQVSPAHTHTPVHSVDTAWLLLWCVVQPNICYVDRAHSRTFQPVGNCTPVIPHLPLTEAQQWHCNPAGLWVQMISGFKLGFWVSVHISERLWSVAAFICCHLLQTVGTQLRLCASLTAALLTSVSHWKMKEWFDHQCYKQHYSYKAACWVSK